MGAQRREQPEIVARSPKVATNSLRSSGEPERSEEHTSELQSQSNLVCRLLLEKKKTRHYLNARYRFYVGPDLLLHDEWICGAERTADCVTVQCGVVVLLQHVQYSALRAVQSIT